MTYVDRAAKARALFLAHCSHSILSQLSRETIGLVAATMPEIQASSPAIMLRMWHELEDDDSRALLFAEFLHQDRRIGFIEAVGVSARAGGGPGLHPLGPVRLPPQNVAEQTIEPVFLRCLGEGLRHRATPAVLNAWRQAFRHLTGHLRT